MTERQEGIIQKVFKEAEESYFSSESETDYTITYEQARKRLRYIQEKLIAEIKLVVLSIYEQNPTFPSYILKLIQKELIGDNQE
jgi:hypothetical protein